MSAVSEFQTAGAEQWTARSAKLVLVVSVWRLMASQNSEANEWRCETGCDGQGRQGWKRGVLWVSSIPNSDYLILQRLRLLTLCRDTGSNASTSATISKYSRETRVDRIPQWPKCGCHSTRAVPIRTADQDGRSLWCRWNTGTDDEQTSVLPAQPSTARAQQSLRMRPKANKLNDIM